MREPWHTLFHGYDDHWLIGQYLGPDEPDLDALLADERIESLSSGERTLIHTACSFRPFRDGSFYALDRPHRVRIAMALLDMS